MQTALQAFVHAADAALQAFVNAADATRAIHQALAPLIKSPEETLRGAP